ncbi:MAG: PQQ-dependent sugar dehydrogenase [Phycisphaeraceae bacterium]|nr:MAG: PQQ-dependent sugar dehydrogenase [Phycisphaeraceae bacterium]
MNMKRTFAIVAAAGLASVAWGGGAPLRTDIVVSGLARPVLVTHAPGDYDRIFILEQRSGSTGRVRIFDLTTNTLLTTPFLSVTVSTSSEQGLLGMAFHPDYANNGYFYINYTDTLGDTHIVRYQVDALDPNLADASSAQQVMFVDQPFTNHNCGWLEFGPDGYLYCGFGDGGSAGDPGARAQNLTQMLGKILRLDVDGDDFPADSTRNYAIPPTNPFVGITGNDEIWAYGVRNPWRNAFDSQTGDLWIADVGQNNVEEIDFQPASDPGGVNYGWRCYEGNNPYNTTGCGPSTDYTFPIYTYTHSAGACSITGGRIYRGCAIPELDGTYFFADYCSSNVWSMKYDGVNVTDFENRTFELTPGSAISSFGEDAYGEIYICNLGGQVRKIVRDAAPLNDCDGNGVEDACQVAAGNPPACGCNAADIAEPYGVLDLQDVQSFIAGFLAQDPVADIAPPFGVFDLADLQAFVSAFLGGCP